MDRSLKRTKSLQSVNWGSTRAAESLKGSALHASQPRQMVKEPRNPGECSWVWNANEVYTRERYQGYNSESARPAGVQPIPAAC